MSAASATAFAAGALLFLALTASAQERTDTSRSAAEAPLVDVVLPAGTTSLEGYRIGTYPDPADRGPSYAAPATLTRVGPDQLDVALSEHFRVGQFLCKQEAGWPRFVVVQPRLLALLEATVVALTERGHPVQTLAIMSGYRTPAYNQALGNVAHSRHIYGDAADVFVDEDGNGRMDDLDGNGREELADALWLRDLIASLVPAVETPDTLPVGGLAAYAETTEHGPFVHIDARGYPARWGVGRPSP
ncbi:MAG: D-Ala-D-Ala carboxypeptidase family metallohydrolase [Pseudomonadota bacterium]